MRPTISMENCRINHMAWLLEITRDGVDLYPEIKRRALERETPHNDMVRYEIMKRFGYYVTESSEHNAEYMPYFIKSQYPELIEQFNIPLDEYPRRCVAQIAGWEKMRAAGGEQRHRASVLRCLYIMEAMETDKPYKIGGNVMNTGDLNLPEEACRSALSGGRQWRHSLLRRGAATPVSGFEYDQHQCSVVDH